MDYQRIHDAIIERAKHRTIDDLTNSSVDGYYEKHHIIPKSEGGKNTSDNIVKLTAREHFLIHWMLYRIDTSILSRSRSFWIMVEKTNNVHHKRNYVISSRVYEEARQAVSKVMKGKSRSDEFRKKLSEAKSGKNNHMYGKTHSDEFRKKRSEATSGKNNHMYGKTHSEATRKKIGEAGKGRTHSEATRKKRSEATSGKNNPMYGKTHSEATRKKISEAKKRKSSSEVINNWW